MSSLETGIDILQCFSSERPELGVSEVARRLSVPKSTVSRLLREMMRHGLVERDEGSRRYRPGPLAFRLGTLYQAHLGILDLVDEAVDALVEEFGLTGYIGVLNGADLVVLRVRQGSYPVRFVLEPGYSVPAFTTAIGKALLARLDDDAIRAMHPPTLHYPVTDLTMTIDDLLDQLRQAREQHWTMATGTTFSGFSAVGVAVGGMNGQQAIAFCLSYPAGTAFEDKTGDMIKSLIAHAARIGRRSADPFWTNVGGACGPGPTDQHTRTLPDEASGHDGRVRYEVHL